MVMERCISWYEGSLQKKARNGLTLSIRGCPTTLTIINNYCMQLKAYVRTARMPYAKVRNFLTWSDFTILSKVKLVVLSRENIV